MESEFLNLNEVFSQIKFHPVVQLPTEYEVLDFAGNSIPRPSGKFSIGKYNERRPGMYTSDLFGKDGEEHRDIHMGVDIGAPAATPVFSFFAGSVFCAAVNSSSGDYGGTIITEHMIAGVFDKLSMASAKQHQQVKIVCTGTRMCCSGPITVSPVAPPHTITIRIEFSFVQVVDPRSIINRRSS